MSEQYGKSHESYSEASIILRPLSPADAEELFNLYLQNQEALDAVSIYVPVDLEDVLDKIRYPMPEGRMDYVISADDRVIGHIDLIPQGSRRAAINYWIDKNSQGRGYAQKAISSLAKYAFNYMGIEELRGWVNIENSASIKTLEKVGFVHQDTNQATKSLGYTLTKEEFERRHKSKK